MQRKILFTIFFSWISICHATPDFIGTYKCKGYDPYLKKNYSGTVVISQQNTVYKVDMDYDTGEKYNGTAGLFDDNSISVVFQSKNDLKLVGLERYAYIENNPKLIGGYWVYLGKDKLGTEECEKQ